MDSFLTYTALGLVVGAIYAIAASGLVLTYNTSGIFNLAHGAQAMIGAFVYYQLNVDWGLPTWLSLVLVLGVLGPGMGLALHLLVMRRLRDTEAVTRIVVSVAILLGLVSLSQWVWDPTEARVPPMLFGAGNTVSVAGVTLRYHHVLCLAIALLLAVVLRLLFTRTRFGVLMRATVDDADLTRLCGHDPDRVSAIAWSLGSTLAVLAGVLITPVIGGTLEANALTLLVVDAFAAAVFGRLRSIPLTFLGAIVLGLGSTWLVGFAPTEWTWVGNFQKALPMVVLMAVLLFLPHDRLRGAVTRSRERYEVPTVRRSIVWAAVWIAGVLAFRLLVDDSMVGTLLAGVSFALMALSVTLLTGYAGELNLAPLSFAAVATLVAYHVGASGSGAEARLSLWGVLAGVLVAASAGALVALPALRLRGLYLALATLAFGAFVAAMLLRDTTPHTVLGHTFTIFPGGNILMPPLAVGPVDLADPDVFLVVVSALFAAVGVGLVSLRNRSYGRRLAAMKDSPTAAAMLGQRLLVLKLSVFAISTGIAGLGGIFMAMAVTSVSAETFGLIVSLSLVMMAVVAGIGYVSGALAAGLIIGAGLSAVVLSLNGVAAKHPEYADSLGMLTHLMLVSTALVGISVSQHPSGFLHEVFAGHRRLAAAPEVRVGGVAVQAVLYVVALAGPMSTTLFVVASAAMWLSLPTVGTALRPAKLRLGPHRVPPELQGLDGVVTPELVARVDQQLGIVLPPRATTMTPGEPVAVRGVRSVPA